MVLGYVMIGLGLAGFAGMDIVYPLYKKHSDKKARNKQEEDTQELSLAERGKVFTQLFRNMGIMKDKDWIKVNAHESKKCYYMTKFTLSDSLPLSSFTKRLEDIRNKLGVPYLEIISEGTSMCFLFKRDEMPMEKYEYIKTPHHLVLLGLDLDSKPVYWNLKSDPHVGLYANSGAGKSTLTHTPICHTIQNNPRASFYFIDLKNGVEYSAYKDIPQCKGFAKDIESAQLLISEIEAEAERRYKIMEEANYRDYYKYIADKPRSNMTHCFIFIDEFATLMFNKKKNGKDETYDCIDTLVELATKIRFVGMHIFAGTQRCTRNYIHPDLKSNLTCTIGMRVMNKPNSDLILECADLHKLKPRQGIVLGDGEQKFFRAYYMDDDIINSVVSPLKTNKSNDKEPDSKKHESKNVIDVDFKESPLK